MSDEPAVLHWQDEEIKLRVVRGTEDEAALDISKLRANTGLITLDYGYVNTGATESAITFIDGDEGILRYRGYDITSLADREDPSFLETAFLLIYGNLPTEDDASGSATRSASTRCCARTSSASTTASRRTRTRWRRCPPSSARCRPSTRTPKTRMTPRRSS